MLSPSPASVPLRLQPARASSPAQQWLTLHQQGDPRRLEVEACVREVYAQRYGALVPAFAPLLLALREGGRVIAAAGCRRAAQGTLFLERYLPAPAEVLIGQQAGRPVQRSDIVEVGHLTSLRGGAGRHMIEQLCLYLAAQDCTWVVSTAIAELHALFVRLQLAPLVLGRADPQALGDDAGCWGSYYDHRPVVLAIHLPPVLRRHALRLARAASEVAR